MERWKEVGWISGYRGVLEISDSGKVMRHSYKYEAIHKSGQIIETRKPDLLLKQFVHTNGYSYITARINEKRKKIYVHRLVATAFVSGFIEGMNVNHKNGIKTDNNYKNLEWVTHGRNVQHAWENGLVDLSGENQPGSKISNQDVSNIKKLIADGMRIVEIASAYSVSVSTIYKIKQGIRWVRHDCAPNM